jgi:hypothetical protein
LKIRNRVGPTCQPQRPLNRSHWSLTRTCDIGHSDTAVTVHQRWPPPVDPSCLIPYTTASRSKSFFPLLSTPFRFLAIVPCSALLSGRCHSLLDRRSSRHPLFDSFSSLLAIAKGSRCFSTRFCSSSFTLSTPTPDPVVDFCWPPVSSLLRASRRQPSGAQCPMSSCAARGQFWSTFFHYSRVSPSTPSSSTALSAPPMSTIVPASPPRFSCSGM